MFQESSLSNTTARTVSLTQVTLDEQLPLCLHEHGHQLRRIANDLPFAARRPLEDEIERLEEILETLAAAQQPKEVSD
jgi:hypothetical protein